MARGRAGRAWCLGAGQQTPGSPEGRAQGEGEEEWVQWIRREQEEEDGQGRWEIRGRGQEPLLIGCGLVGLGLVGRGLVGCGL